MLCLYLFDTLNLGFEPLLYITKVPNTYFIGHAADFCVIAYCFISGYEYDATGDKMQYMKVLAYVIGLENNGRECK